VPAATSGAKRVQGMRTPGSSIPAKDLWVGGRDVTADKFISAVSLLVECAAGVLSLGDPARGVAASPSSVPSPNVSGSTDGGLADRDTRSKWDGRRNVSRRSSPNSPPVGKSSRRCWRCGAAGHLLRGCPEFRGWCRRVRGARAAGDRSVVPGTPRGGHATRPGTAVKTAARPRAEKARGVDLNRPKECPGLRPHQPIRWPERPSRLGNTGAGEPTPAPKGAKSGSCGCAVSRPAGESDRPRCGDRN